MNEKKILMISNIIKIAFIVIGVIVSAMVINGPNVTAGKEAVEQFRDGGQMGMAVGFTGFLIFLCTGLVILFYIFLLISDWKKALKSMIGIIAFAVLYMIINAIGTSDTSETLALKNAVSDSTVDSTHAGLITSIIALSIAALTLVWSFIRKFFL
ncbi:MAG: hypothetical protein HYU67_00125 [Flavobacteriia bacterium]|nr:hypothetical protein [Flavobacteriia bacterium]